MHQSRPVYGEEEDESSTGLRVSGFGIGGRPVYGEEEEEEQGVFLPDITPSCVLP